MGKSRYKKLPGVDHGSANDSPINQGIESMQNLTDPGGVNSSVMNRSMVNPGRTTGMNPETFAGPLAQGSPVSKLGEDLAKMNKLAEELEEGGLSEEQAITTAESEVESMG